MKSSEIAVSVPTATICFYYEYVFVKIEKIILLLSKECHLGVKIDFKDAFFQKYALYAATSRIMQEKSCLLFVCIIQTTNKKDRNIFTCIEMLH